MAPSATVGDVLGQLEVKAEEKLMRRPMAGSSFGSLAFEST